jgi:hypothetical protein
MLQKSKAGRAVMGLPCYSHGHLGHAVLAFLLLSREKIAQWVK